ncbi:hypothetical protein HDE_01305 [Halotydeus destructor]|nr:hypothetical protein HDE_01305 [Halotydeus destructor]
MFEDDTKKQVIPEIQQLREDLNCISDLKCRLNAWTLVRTKDSDSSSCPSLSQGEVAQLREQVRLLEQVVTAQQDYIHNMRKAIVLAFNRNT